MKRIVLDFLARWWWMVALVVVFAGLSALGQPVIFTPAALVCLILDAQRGLFRAVRPLPLTRREQALTWWFIGVLMLSLISLVPLGLGTEIYVWNHSATAALSPWFYAAVIFWVGLGYAGFAFLLAMRLPTRPAVGVLENIEQGIIGGLWGFSMPGLIFILLNLPKTPSAILPWHIWVFAAVPVFVVLSFLAAPDMMRRRMFVVAANIKSRPAPESSSSLASGLTGIPLFLVTFIGRIIIMMALIIFFQCIFLSFKHGLKDVLFNHIISFQLAIFSILIGGMSVEMIGLRSVRCLPLSRAQLTALLLSVPCATGFCTAIFTAWGGVGNPALTTLLNFIAQALALAGCGALALAALLHMASGGRIFLMMFVSIIAIFGFEFLCKYPLLLGISGVFALVLAFGLIRRGLRKSNAFYQPRRVFGVMAGQPMAVR